MSEPADSTRRLERGSAPATVAALSIALFAVATAALGGGAEPIDRLIEFAIKDQFDRVYTHESFAGQGLIVIAGDRVGSRYVGDWGTALREGLEQRGRGDDYRRVGLSDLDGVPRLLRNTIRKRFPTDEAAWVLMDWEGVFAEAYHFEKKRCTLLAFSSEGDLILRKSVESVDPATAGSVLDILAPPEAESRAPSHEP